jgi:Zn-dependent metalloprotease
MIPPYISQRLGETPEHESDHRFFRGQRRSIAAGMTEARFPTTQVTTIWTAKNKKTLPGVPINRSAQAADSDYNRVKRSSDLCLRFFKEVYGRQGIDGENMQVVHTIHYDRKYNNAFWDGTQMVYGDGDGKTFASFTLDIDIIGHELTHGINQYGVNLDYHGEAGAINEHLSDVFGILIKQWSLKQNSSISNWLIGELLFPEPQYALRSMAAPGTAYRNHPILGTDPQPGHMDKFIQTTDDDGGVHLNSGILNKVFYLACLHSQGTPHWRTIGQVWYDVLIHHTTNTDMTFREFKEIILTAASNRIFLIGEVNYNAIKNAFAAVGL